jgi:hypothetical protein
MGSALLRYSHPISRQNYALSQFSQLEITVPRVSQNTLMNEPPANQRQSKTEDENVVLDLFAVGKCIRRFPSLTEKMGTG